ATLVALLDGDGFGQVAGLIHVAAAADGDVIGEQLQGDDLQQDCEQFRRGGQLDDVIGGFASQAIALSDDGDDDAVARLDLFDIGDALFVQSERGGIGIVARGENHNGKIFVNQRVGAVLHFAGRV